MTSSANPPLASSVIGPGWVDQRTTSIMGLFPLSVERHVNSAVADHAFGVTTVTRAAQYYALHGLIADEARSRGLTNEETRSLLRRVEVVYEAAYLAHESTPEHPPSGAIDPHGADFLRPLLSTGSVDLRAMTKPGPGTFATLDAYLSNGSLMATHCRVGVGPQRIRRAAGSANPAEIWPG